MSRVTKLDRYPKQYLEIADQIENGANEVVLGPFASRAAANSYRLDLYSFRRALEDSEFKQDYVRFAGTRIYIAAKAPWTVSLRHADAKTVKVAVK